VAVIVVLAILIVGLGFANVIPGFHLSGSPAPKASTTPSKYLITIHQSGLPSSTSWSFTLAGSTQDSSGTSLSFSEPNGSYSYSVGPVTGYSPDKSSGSIDVAGGPVSLTVTFSSNGGSGPGPTAYPVTFQETGLPAGTGWSISFNGTSLTSTGASITTHAVNGSYPYTVPAVTGYTASPSSGTATVDGAAVSYPIAFSAVPPSSFPVTFTETGLPGGASWSVDLASSPQSATGSTITFSEPNGSYLYTVAGPSGYAPDASSGTAKVDGHPVSVPVAFSAVSSSSYYAVTFDQTGLASNLTWGPQEYLSAAGEYPVFGTTGEGSTIVQSLPNGTYYWTMATVSANNGTELVPNPAAGSLTVAGANLSVPVVFKPASNVSTNSSGSYPVSVYETGLPATTAWFAFAGSGGGPGVSGSPINFSLSNGTYTVFAFSLTAGYSVQHDPTITVAGAPVSVTVLFVHAYSVTFNATGIGNTSYWQVNVSGTGIFGVTTEGSTGPGTLSFTVLNGSLNYSASAFPYHATPDSGSLTIAGSGRNISLVFTPLTTYPVTFTESGLPTGTGWGAAAIENGDPGGLDYAAHPVDGTSGGTNGTSFALDLPDGNYSWTSGTDLSVGYWAGPATGFFEVDGPGPMINITFSTIAPNVTPILVEEADFYDTGAGGLPNGTTWGITIGGSTVTTAGMFLALVEPNGTYSYTVDAPTGYWALPGGGSFTVRYAPNGTASAPSLSVAFFAGTPPAALKAVPATAAGSAGPGSWAGAPPSPTAALRSAERW
jgi:hypothetical protein